MEVNGKSEIPTGEVDGQLSNGVIVKADLSGPLIGNTVTDLTNLMKNDSVYVVVHTRAHEIGEIQGVVFPSNIGYTDICKFWQMSPWFYILKQTPFLGLAFKYFTEILI